MKLPRIPQLVVPPGAWGTVEFAVRASGGKPAEKFLEELGDDAAVFLALFEEMAANGRTNNPKFFSQESGEIYAFKQKANQRQARFPCFNINNRWILCFGFYKPGAQKGRGKWRQDDIDKANNIRKEHLEVERKQREQDQRNRNSRQR